MYIYPYVKLLTGWESVSLTLPHTTCTTTTCITCKLRAKTNAKSRSNSIIGYSKHQPCNETHLHVMYVYNTTNILGTPKLVKTSMGNFICTQRLGCRKGSATKQDIHGWVDGIA